MNQWKRMIRATVASLAVFASASIAGEAANGLSQQGKPDLKSAGPLAFGPKGVLLVGDPQGAAIFAIGVEAKASGKLDSAKIEGVDEKVAAALGTQASDIAINDLAIQPETGTVFLSVSRGKGPTAVPVIVTLDASGKTSEVALDNVAYSKVVFANAPAVNSGGGRRAPSRIESITDIEFIDGQVIVAGLSNEEFSSKLRSIPYPFSQADDGASVEIYHGAHGAVETRAPVRTFTALTVAGKPHLLAAYTCTPLVKFPLEDLKPGKKIRGTTIAELGNRNRPIDMIVYSKDGKEFLLMANSARGVMKIPTSDFDKQEAIESRISDKAGIKYETIANLKGVEQLAKLSDTKALILSRTDDKKLNLEAIDLP